MTFQELIASIAEKNAEFKVQQNTCKFYSILETAENGPENWRKGPSYVALAYKSGVTFELWNYGEKQGAFLTEFTPMIKAFDGVKLDVSPTETVDIKYRDFRKAGMLRIKLPNEFGIEKSTEICLKFIEHMKPTVEHIRANVKLPVKVAKIVPAVEAVKTEEVVPPVEEVKVEEVIPVVTEVVVPVLPVEEIKVEVPVPEVKVVQKAAKKHKK